MRYVHQQAAAAYVQQATHGITTEQQITGSKCKAARPHQPAPGNQPAPAATATPARKPDNAILLAGLMYGALGVPAQAAALAHPVQLRLAEITVLKPALPPAHGEPVRTAITLRIKWRIRVPAARWFP